MTTGAHDEVSIYVIAHADDWQLFMTMNAYNDLKTAADKKRSNVSFIQLSAGDAGKEDDRFWRSRELGAKSSVRMCMAPFVPLKERSEECKYRGHTITRWLVFTLGHADITLSTYYFLRLPDGNVDGGGFERYGYQSLTKLKNRQIQSISAVDTSATYDGWGDLLGTIQEIIETACQGSGTNTELWINYPDPDTGWNQGDHADHIAVGQAVGDLELPRGMKRASFLGYKLRDRNDLLPGERLFRKAAVFSAYEKGVFDGSGYSTLSEGNPPGADHVKWCLRDAQWRE